MRFKIIVDYIYTSKLYYLLILYYTRHKIELKGFNIKKINFINLLSYLLTIILLVNYYLIITPK